MCNPDPEYLPSGEWPYLNAIPLDTISQLDGADDSDLSFPADYDTFQSPAISAGMAVAGAGVPKPPSRHERLWSAPTVARMAPPWRYCGRHVANCDLDWMMEISHQPGLLPELIVANAADNTAVFTDGVAWPTT